MTKTTIANLFKGKKPAAVKYTLGEAKPSVTVASVSAAFKKMGKKR